MAEMPRGFHNLSWKQQQEYREEVAALGARADSLRAAREDGGNPKCRRCQRSATRVDRDGRCEFCGLTYFLRYASGSEIARFVVHATAVL